MKDMALYMALGSFLLSACLWVSKTNPILGGFILSLPLTTLITLGISQLQTGKTENTFLLAKSIFLGVPLSLLFFIPFLIAPKLKIGFWPAYVCGIALLFIAYLIHKKFFY
jgi:hypothetical protein